MDEHRVANYIELCGSNYEIGFQMGMTVRNIDMLKSRLLSVNRCLSESDIHKATSTFDCFCPGLNEELQGFADANEIDISQVIYYAVTYLVAGCSQIVFIPRITDGHCTLLARNYDYFPDMDDWVLSKTRVSGKYAHLGTNIMQFGRGEGVNEYGFAVSQSACGRPVNNFANCKRPVVDGLQFWAIVRTLLENTKSVDDALHWIKNMPITCNINLMLADKEGHVALVEIFDNHRAICQIDNNSRQGYIAATNHIHLPELRQLEPWAMQNSVCRLETIKKSLQHKTEVSADFIKALLLREYPNGLKVSHYQCSFGTIKSMIFNLEECSVEICWGGVSDNHWKRYSLNTSTPNEQFKQVIIDKPPSDAFFELIAL